MCVGGCALGGNPASQALVGLPLGSGPLIALTINLSPVYNSEH